MEEEIDSRIGGNTAAFSIYRMISRPIIKWEKVLWNTSFVLLIDLILTICSWKIVDLAGGKNIVKKLLKYIKYIYCVPIDNYIVQIFMLFLLCSILIHLKKIMLFCVRLYQYFAPEMMRKSCLFTPSCSEYMILAIEKYGCVKGFIKGVKRIRRCHTPNGGVDYP